MRALVMTLSCYDALEIVCVLFFYYYWAVYVDEAVPPAADCFRAGLTGYCDNVTVVRTE